MIRRLRIWLIEKLGGDAYELRNPPLYVYSPILGLYMLTPEEAAFERDMRERWELTP